MRTRRWYVATMVGTLRAGTPTESHSTERKARIDACNRNIRAHKLGLTTRYGVRSK